LADPDTTGLLGIAAGFGAASLPIYAVSVAFANDHMARAEMVPASSALLLVYGVGATIGPFGGSLLMEFTTPHGFFWWLAGVHAVVVVAGVLRSFVVHDTVSDEQTQYVPLPPMGIGRERGAMWDDDVDNERR
jgi:MFS family permease